MNRIITLLSAVVALLLIFISGAFAQQRETDGRDYYYHYRSEQRSTSGMAPQDDRSYMDKEINRSYYYENMDRGGAPPGTTVVQSEVPPPISSDIQSERINRKATRPSAVYQEKDQGVPTRVVK